MQKFPQGGEENTYIRMVISYWDMVASIVNRGLIDDELFFESNGEIWVVWDRMRSRLFRHGARPLRIHTCFQTSRTPARDLKRGGKGARLGRAQRCEACWHKLRQVQR